MNIINKLHEKFQEIINASFEKENNINFLRIEVAFKKLDDIIKVSKVISSFLDLHNDEIDDEYVLDVFSSGTDQAIKIENIKNNLDKNLRVFLKNEIKDKEFFEGKIIDFNEKSLKIKWNSKGQFLKQKIDFENIKEIKLYAKAK